MNKQPEALRLAELLEAIGALEAADELRRLHQVDVAHGWWLDKTEWVQESSECDDLGRHRADVMKRRIDRLHDENEALRAALEQSQGEQLKGCHKIEKPCRVGKWNFGVGNLCRRVIEEAQHQYTHPQPKREPLTSEQIAAATGAKPGTPLWLVAVSFIRAAEAAHGIK